MKRLRITGIITIVLLIITLLVPSALAVPAPAGIREGCLRDPFIIETGRDDLKDGFRFNGFKRYDQFFDKLVSEGAISAEQKDAIRSAVENAVKDARQQGNWKIDMSTVLAALVKNGTITEDQKTAIENALRAERLVSMTRRLKGALDRLISHGTITAQDAQKILAAVTDAQKSDCGFDLNALLENLKKAGTLEEKQLDAIREALMPPAHFRMSPG